MKASLIAVASIAVIGIAGPAMAHGHYSRSADSSETVTYDAYGNPIVTPATSPVYVRGYVTHSGNYVQPHYRTAPDSSRLNNWSTQGNVNPYTGSVGTVNPYPAYPTYPAYPSSNYYAQPAQQAQPEESY